MAGQVGYATPSAFVAAFRRVTGYTPAAYFALAQAQDGRDVAYIDQLGTVALLGIIGVWNLHYVLIVPSLFPDTLPLGWVELCVTAGFLGAFIYCAIPGLKQLAEVAVSDGPETSDEAAHH